MCLIGTVRSENRSDQMAAAKKLTAAILARRASKGSRGKRTWPEPRQYTVADLERARDRVAAAARRLDNAHTSNPNRGRAGLERAQLELQEPCSWRAAGDKHSSIGRAQRRLPIGDRLC